MDGSDYRHEDVWLRLVGAGALALLACASAGCAASNRADFLAIRDAAPSPRKSAPVTLAEAERSSGERRQRAIARVAEVPVP